MEEKKINKEEVDRIIKAHQLWLENPEEGTPGKLEHKDLSYMDFSNLDIQDFSFMDSNLFKAKFKNSNVSHCNFRYADIGNADFTHANVEGSNFEYACAEYTKFVGANLSYVLFFNTIINFADMRGARIDYLTLTISRFTVGVKIDEEIKKKLTSFLDKFVVGKRKKKVKEKKVKR